MAHGKNRNPLRRMDKTTSAVKLVAVERIVQRVNQKIKVGAIDAAMVALVMIEKPENVSHPINAMIAAEIREEGL